MWALALAGGLASAVGCQVEYAGMTLPSGKYMYDDVQYFPPGPDFPWANTNAATQRARMQAMGMDVNVGPLPGAPNAPVMTPPPAAGAPIIQQGPPNGPANLNNQLIQPGGNMLEEDEPPMIAPPPNPGEAVPPPDF
jgi:hypothetical protein